MEYKRTTESVVQEIMGLVDDVLGCDSAGYQFECKRQIQSKLRELVERCSMREPLSDEVKKKLLCEWSYSQFTGKGDFLDGVEAAESAHNITNTTKE